MAMESDVVTIMVMIRKQLILTAFAIWAAGAGASLFMSWWVGEWLSTVVAE